MGKQRQLKMKIVHSRKQENVMRLRGMREVAKDGAPIIRALGGAVIETHPFGKKTTRFWATALMVDAAELVRRTSKRVRMTTQSVAEILAHGGMLAGKGVTDASVLDLPLAAVITEFMGATIYFGSLIRLHPDGRTYIQTRFNDWQEATDELLKSYDAQKRLGGEETLDQMAARLIMEWKARGKKEE